MSLAAVDDLYAVWAANSLFVGHSVHTRSVRAARPSGVALRV